MKLVKRVNRISKRKTYQILQCNGGHEVACRKLQKWTIKVEGGLEYRRRIYISTEDISGKKTQRWT